MLKFKFFAAFLFSFFIVVDHCEAQKLNRKEQQQFQEKCKQLAQVFCGYIEELTEENSNTENMTIPEFFNSEVCQFTIGQLQNFFSDSHSSSSKVIGYTPNGVPPVEYANIDNYIKLLLNQRKRYQTVRYDFSAYVLTELDEKEDENGNVYYEGEVSFKQNFMASKNHKGNSELGWDIFHEDYKKLTFRIEQTKTRDGEYFAITFHKLELDLKAY